MILPAPTRTTRTWITVVGLLLLPVLLGGVLIAALYNPTERLENMTAAIVNDDEPVTIDGQYTPLGRQLAAGLVEGADDQDSNLTWVLSNDDDAAEGLADGSYQAVVTIPQNFSAAAMSAPQALSGVDEEPEQAMIDVETAPNALIVDEAIMNQVASLAASSMSEMLSEATLSNLLIGFSTMGDQLGDAADGAHQLADGATEAGNGAGELGDGASQVADGIGQLGDGLGELSEGAGSAASGAYDLSGGARELAGGAPALADGAAQLADGAGDLADGVPELVTGAAGLADGAQGIAEGLAGVDAGLNGDGSTPGLAPGLAALADGLADGVEQIRSTELVPDDLARAAAGSATGSREIAGGLEQLAAACAASGAVEEFCAQVSALSEAAGPTAEAAEGTEAGLAAVSEAPAGMAAALDESVAAARQLAGGGEQLAAGVPELRAGAEQLAGGARQLEGGANALGDGARQLADGTDELAGGVAQFGAGAGALSEGASGLADGVGQLATGVGAAAANVPTLADGATQVADGVDGLGDGVGELADGAGTLADGLDEAVEAVPSYSDREAEDLASVVASPVSTSAGTGLFGAAAIPLLAAVVLWFGGIATFLALRAFPASALSSRRSSAFLAGRGLLPAAGLGAAQGALIAGVVQIAAGYSAGVFWGLLGVSVVTGIAFAAVHQALVAVFRRAGTWIAAIVGAVALAAGIVSTLPGFLVAVRGALPTTPAFDTMLAVINGSGGVGAGLVALSVWTVLSFLITLCAVVARRSVRSARLLEPSLV